MKYLKTLALILLATLSSCVQKPNKPYLSIAGFTQGTTYHITYECPTNDSVNYNADVKAILAEFDMSLSTYIDSSLISRINKNEEGIETDEYFEVVFKEAQRIHKLSDGAFDLTVGPLINAWGFGPGMKMEMSPEIIDSLLQFVGMEKVRIENHQLIKDRPEIYLDVNAIAQGYSVDIVADFFEAQQISNYMVEIGGEIRTAGISPSKKSWRVGIDKPVYGNKIPGQQLQNVANMTNKSLASSGNYRKFYELEDGRKIVHTLDPKTGYTKMSQLLSVTIICNECITADALATSCMALGLENAKTFIESIEGAEAYFIFSDEEGLYFEWKTEGMKAMLDR